MSANDKNTLYKLCEQAAKEQDPDKPPELAKEILRLTNPEGQQPRLKNSGAKKRQLEKRVKGLRLEQFPGTRAGIGVPAIWPRISCNQPKNKTAICSELW